MCLLVGAGLDHVQRLQGHDAGVPGHGRAEEVLPLPVLQHLQGRSPGAPGLVAPIDTCILLRRSCRFSVKIMIIVFSSRD
jgi:hypothetical protein